MLAAYRAGWWASRKVPAPVARAAFAAIADLAWRANGRGVRRLRSNLARVRPAAGADELQALTRAGMRSYMRYWCESFRLPTYTPAQITAVVRTCGEQHFRAAVDRGHGVVVALPHMANWDLAGAWGAVTTPGGVLTVAERLEPVELFDAFVAYRARLGIDVLALTGGAEPFPLLTQRLRAGGMVALVADRDLSVRGLPVQFFGATATMPAGPAALALRTGASLLGVTLHYDGPTLAIDFSAPLTTARRGRDGVVDLTQQLADVFATAIAAHPADWHMLQRIWRQPADESASEVAETGADISAATASRNQASG
jgi:KDO2-lipid IV(A) lauroyltransferase